ncbi:MAG: hypothetical protein WC022_01680 [Parcubacteria group bacterium]
MNRIKTKKQKFLFSLFFLLLVAGGFGLNNSSLFGHIASAQNTTTTTTNSDDTPAYSGDTFGDTIIGSNKTKKSDTDTIGKSGGFIVFLLKEVLAFMGLLIRVATSIFNWVVDPANMNSVINNDIIYTTWALVRDTLNIAFILVLLFSAFSTVFQVDKYSYKGLLKTLVLMALLVNFSFPITRFIIDFSNSLMYYLINTSGLGISNVNGAFPSIADSSQLSSIIHPATTDISYLLAAIVFAWILAITLLIIAGLFVIRTVALAILIIFSSIAFTGSIIPFSASYASKWWDSLFKYAFFGPVMIFMLGVAIKMMGAISKSGMASMKTVAGQQSTDPSLLAAFSFFSIPIIILWAGIIFAQSMSLTGASAVIGRGQKFMKWAPNSIFKATGVPGGVKKAKDYYGKKGAPMFFGKIPGLRGSEKTEASEAWWAGKVFRVKGAAAQDMKKRAEEYKKENADEKMLINRAIGGDAAAAYRLAEDKRMDQKTYNAFVNKNKDSNLKGEIDTKVKQNNAHIVAINKANNTNSKEYTDTAKANPLWTPIQIQNDVAEKEIGKLTAEKLAEQDWVGVDTKMPAGPDRRRVIRAMTLAINGLATPAKAELQKRISPANRKAINDLAGVLII